MPFGVIEKHAPSGPLGTDLINVRHASVSAARQEYAVVFPEYYFGQIFEAMHQPGTIAYSTHLQLEMLQETTAEMGCNACTKIVIVNGHGGNTNLTQYFTQTKSTNRKTTSCTPSWEGAARRLCRHPRLRRRKRVSMAMRAKASYRM